MSVKIAEEPLLSSENERLNMLPIPVDRMPIWNAYKTAQASNWTAEEIDFHKDLYDWENKLSDNERHFLKHILAFFAQSDAIVNENLAENFSRQCTWPEVKAFYGFQVMIENVHNETYSLQIQTVIRSTEEQQKVLKAIDHFPAIQRKAAWAKRWIENKDASFVERLVAFACVEGIFFAGSFCALFWLRKRRILNGITDANELIERDERMHTEFACLLYSKYVVNKLSDERLEEIVRDAVNIEIEFDTVALPVSLIGININTMTQYIKFKADELLKKLGYKAIYQAQQPFPFMNFLPRKSNLHEGRPSEYGKSAGRRVFTTSANF